MNLNQVISVIHGEFNIPLEVGPYTVELSFPFNLTFIINSSGSSVHMFEHMSLIYSRDGSGNVIPGDYDVPPKQKYILEMVRQTKSHSLPYMNMKLLHTFFINDEKDDPLCLFMARKDSI